MGVEAPPAESTTIDDPTEDGNDTPSAEGKEGVQTLEEMMREMREAGSDDEKEPEPAKKSKGKVQTLEEMMEEAGDPP